MNTLESQDLDAHTLRSSPKINLEHCYPKVEKQSVTPSRQNLKLLFACSKVFKSLLRIISDRIYRGADMERIISCLYSNNPLPVPEGNFGEEVIKGIVQNSGIAMIDVSTGRQVTGPELMTQACRLAGSLTSLGCVSGDVICILSKNSIEWIQCLVAVLYIDAVPAGLNHLLTEGLPQTLLYDLEDISIHLETCRASILICENSLARTAVAATKKLKNHKVQHVIVSGGYEGCLNLKKLVEGEVQTTKLNPTAAERKRSGKELGAIFFSSGTTELQKPVAISHQGLLLQCVVARDPETRYVFDKPILFSPLSHGGGFMPAAAGLLSGSTLFIIPEYDLKIYVDCMTKYQISDIFITPPVALQLAKSSLVDSSKVQLNSLAVGAAPLSKELELQLYKKFPGLKIRQLYGMTELTIVSTGIPARICKPGKQGSIGLPVYNTEMKIVDIVSGASLGPHNSGEICVRSPMMMIEYIENVKATQEIKRQDGWIHTGDIEHYDEDGYFYVTDRIKELIKYNTFQIAPAELESVLLSHPDIADAAVVGVRDREAGEAPLAVVVLKPSVKATEHQIETFVNDKVAAYKKLRGGVKFVSTIPKTGSGKILRREIKALLFGNEH